MHSEIEAGVKIITSRVLCCEDVRAFCPFAIKPLDSRLLQDENCGSMRRPQSKLEKRIGIQSLESITLRAITV
jgi:hypothetical protein